MTIDTCNEYLFGEAMKKGDFGIKSYTLVSKYLSIGVIAFLDKVCSFAIY